MCSLAICTRSLSTLVVYSCLMSYTSSISLLLLLCCYMLYTYSCEGMGVRDATRVWMHCIQCSRGWPRGWCTLYTRVYIYIPNEASLSLSLSVSGINPIIPDTRVIRVVFGLCALGCRDDSTTHVMGMRDAVGHASHCSPGTTLFFGYILS